MGKRAEKPLKEAVIATSKSAKESRGLRLLNRLEGLGRIVVHAAPPAAGLFLTHLGLKVLSLESGVPSDEEAFKVRIVGTVVTGLAGIFSVVVIKNSAPKIGKGIVQLWRGERS